MLNLFTFPMLRCLQLGAFVQVANAPRHNCVNANSVVVPNGWAVLGNGGPDPQDQEQELLVAEQEQDKGPEYSLYIINAITRARQCQRMRNSTI
jgi:hypothetical protein